VIALSFLRQGILFVLFGVIVLISFSVTASLCSYRAPNSELYDLKIGFSYHYYNDPFGLPDRDVDAGRFLIDYSRRYESPDFGFDISVENDMQISTVALSSFVINAEGNLKRYFSPDKSYFGIAGVTGKSASSYKTIGLSAKIGVGYGRFTDVTPMAKAVEIDEYLFSQEAITSHLEEPDLESIAHEINNLDRYESINSLLGALQDILEGSRLLSASGLDALHIYDMAQIVQDDSHPRYCGGSFSVGLGYELLDPRQEANDLLATGSFEYAFTTTPKAQFLISGGFSGAYDFLSTNQMDVRANYDYMLTDTLDVSFIYSFVRETWEGNPTDKHDLSLDVTFTPVKNANIVLSVDFVHEPYFLEWKQEIKFEIVMVLLP
jgi:hypothetical protein